MVVDPYDVILSPVVTEKTMTSMERENKIEFRVRIDATKSQVKHAVEEMFKVKVVSVNTRVTMTGEKHATIKFPEDVKADEIGMRIGIF
ncbi:MAG: 50S ribosomal protein L23 [Methanobacteriota archaeon]